MNKVKYWLHSFINQYSETDLYSKIWFILASLGVTITSILGFTLSASSEENWVIVLSILSTVFGIFCVFGLASKNYWGFFFGIIQVIFYGAVSVEWEAWGQVALSFIVYLPANIYGFKTWNDNNEDDYKVKVERDSISKIALSFLFTILVGVAISLLLGEFSTDPHSWLDGFITAFALYGTYLMITRKPTQWIIWLLVNILTVTLYALFYMDASDPAFLPQIVMWSFNLLNSIYGIIVWYNLISIEKVRVGTKPLGSNGGEAIYKNKIMFKELNNKNKE